MLIDTRRTISYKCSYCGNIHFFSATCFELKTRRELVFSCGCKHSRIKFSYLPNRGLKVEFPCIACGEKHIGTVPISKFFSGDVFSLACPVTGLEQVYIGKDDKVAENLDRSERELDDLADSLGYDSYFKNPRVMLQTLDHIHEIAEAGNLFCECGSRDIELILLADRIWLQCKHCSGHKAIYTGNTGELSKILLKNSIALTDDGDACHI